MFLKTEKLIKRCIYYRHVTIERFVKNMPMPVLEKTVNNYVGIGVDAKITLTFHRFRESYPNVFSSLVIFQN